MSVFGFKIAVQIYEQINEKTEKRSDKDHNITGYVCGSDGLRTCRDFT